MQDMKLNREFEQIRATSFSNVLKKNTSFRNRVVCTNALFDLLIRYTVITSRVFVIFQRIIYNCGKFSFMRPTLCCLVGMDR